MEDVEARIRRLSERVTDLEKELDKGRSDLRQAILAARQAGMSQSALGRVLGVSRQRVRQILDRLE